MEVTNEYNLICVFFMLELALHWLLRASDVRSQDLVSVSREKNHGLGLEIQGLNLSLGLKGLSHGLGLGLEPLVSGVWS